MSLTIDVGADCGVDHSPGVTPDTGPYTATVTGADELVRVPLPSWPVLLYPQHRTTVLVRAQLWLAPDAIVDTLERSLTTTGWRLLAVVPLPSCP